MNIRNRIQKNAQGKRLWITLAVINFILLAACLSVLAGQRQESILLDGLSVDENAAWERTEDWYTVCYPLSAQAGIMQGVYTVTLDYTTEKDKYKIYFDTDRDGKHYPALYGDVYELDGGQAEISFRLWVNSKSDSLNLCVESMDVCRNFEEALRINHMEIRRENGISAAYGMIKICAVLFVINIIAVVILSRKQTDGYSSCNLCVFAGLACVFYIGSCSIFTNALSDGHDLVFHLARIIGLGEELRCGTFPVRMQSAWNNGYGYPVSVFYGDTLLYIPAALYALGVPVMYAYKFYVLLINAGTVCISYFCYKRLSGDRYIGVACAALYCLCVNRILNVCLRAAVGEYSAYMFFPLVLLGVKEIYDRADGKPSSRFDWVFLCIGMTGIIRTHVLSFEMVCLTLGLVAALLLRKTLQKDIFLSFVKSVTATICLNMGFLIPFLDYSGQQIVVLREKSNYGIQGIGLSLYELFSVETTGVGDARLSAEGLENRFPQSLGLGMMIVLLGAVLLLARWQLEQAEKKRLLFVLGLGGCTLFMSTYYFPWNSLAAVAFVRNVVSSIQFPWRFVTVSIPLLTYAACLIFCRIKRSASAEKTRYLLMGICLVTAVQGLQCTDLIVRSVSGFTMYDGREILQKESTVSGGEYLLENTNLAMAVSDTDVCAQNASLTDVQRDSDGITVFCSASQDAFLDFPLFAYKHYECTDLQTGQIMDVTCGDNNRIRVYLPDGYEGGLKVFFREPWYWRGAEMFTFLAVIGLVIYVLIRKKAHEGARGR